MVQPPQGAIPFPQIEILEDCGSRREILWQSAPLTPRSENIQDRVRHLAHVRRAWTPASLRSPDMRRDQGPFGVGQIRRVAKPFAFIPAAVPRCPHRAPPTQVPDTESQPIPKTQLLSEPTLRGETRERQSCSLLPSQARSRLVTYRNVPPGRPTEPAVAGWFCGEAGCAGAPACFVRHSPGVVRVHRRKAWLKALGSE